MKGYREQVEKGATELFDIYYPGWELRQFFNLDIRDPNQCMFTYVTGIKFSEKNLHSCFNGIVTPQNADLFGLCLKYEHGVQIRSGDFESENEGKERFQYAKLTAEWLQLIAERKISFELLLSNMEDSIYVEVEQ